MRFYKYVARQLSIRKYITHIAYQLIVFLAFSLILKCLWCSLIKLMKCHVWNTVTLIPRTIHLDIHSHLNSIIVFILRMYVNKH